MSDNRAASKEPTARLEELKEQIERASALIGELRETNYSLTTELVELKNRLAAGETPALDSDMDSDSDASSEDAAAGTATPTSDESELADEIELLRTERETVRKKLKSLIARIEKLES